MDLSPLVITGAGISASAGLRTYRAQGALWSNPELEKLHHASRYGNHLDILVPLWLGFLQEIMATRPTAAHEALASRGWPVITQNVDGLHQEAGSQDVLEIHGSYRTWRCLRGKHSFPGEDLLAQGDPAQERLTPYTCPLCGSHRIRPSAVLFGEPVLGRRRVKEILPRGNPLVYVGTSGQVEPVASFHLRAATSLLVDPVPWGSFTHYMPIQADAWAARGCPLEGG